MFKNLDGAFDPEEIFFVGTQAARLGMPEATEILGRGRGRGLSVLGMRSCAIPGSTPIREQPGFADVVRRAEQARKAASAAFREAGGPALLGLS